MNLQTHSATGKTPFEVMFNRTTRWLDQLEPWNRPNMTQNNIEDEEVLENETSDMQTEIDGWQSNYIFDMDIEPTSSSTGIITLS